MSLLFRTASLAVSAFFAYAAAGGLTTDGASLSAQVVAPVLTATDALPATPDVARAPDDGIGNPAPEADANDHSGGKIAKPVVTATVETPVDAVQHNCVATAVYYESKGEPVAGQLAVARVIMNRAKSGRFAKTPCGVVTQPSQFSFVHGGVLPTAPDNAMWRQAKLVARMAMQDGYAGPAASALYFHAKRVAPGWNRTSLGAIGNHIFYR
jgi:spore germination cell wall hydrolase CwlJ-like protein